MLKKTGCFLAAVFLACSLRLFAAASVPVVSDSVSPPVIGESAERDTGTDRVITLSYSARTAEAETVRKAYLEKLMEDHTPEEIASSDAAWILHGAVVFCEVSADGKNWSAVKTAAEENGRFELSLMEDVLPALARGGEEMHRRIYGFDYQLRLVIASDDYVAEDKNRVFVMSAPSETVTFHCPEFTFVDCAIPDDAELTLEYPAFMYYPNKEELPLPYPTRPGYFFAGWMKWGGGYTETVPAESRYYRVVAQWEPRSYAVNYVLSTVSDPVFSYTFGRANNTVNPTSHMVGCSEPLYDIKSPVGGYDFDGWFTTPDFSGEKLTQIPEDAVGDMILYARWITFEERDARKQSENEAYARSLHYGDVDFDGAVTASDARLVLRTSVGLENLTPEALRRADLYDSAIITSANARTILRISVGLDSLYDVLVASGIITPEKIESA